MQINAIVGRYLFGKSDYVKWSIQMKTYLVGQDLWDIVEADEPSTAAATDDDNGTREGEIKTWKKKNAVALHTIQISCGGHAFDLIQEINSAKIAWDTLADNYKQQFIEDCKESKSEFHEVSTESESEFDDDLDLEENKPKIPDYHQYESLLKALHCDDCKAVKGFLAKNPEAVRVRICDSGLNALHFAVATGQSNIVEELVPLMTEEDLLMEEMNGFTALALAIRRENVSMAERLIKKNKKLVSVHIKGRLPVLYAGICHKPQMIRFLYSVTPLEHLISLENRKRGSELISHCVHLKQFDIALDLLKHCPHLAITPYAPMRSPLVDLSYSQVFESVGQLRFWQRWIYDRIDVPDCSKNDISIDVQNVTISHKGITAINSGVFRRFGGVLVLLGHLVSSGLLQLLDVKHIYEVKFVQVQALELLSRMCKVIESIFDPKPIKYAGMDEALTQAVHNGNVEFIKSIAKANPSLVWIRCRQNIVFSLAMQLRQVEVFNLIYGLHNKEEIIENCILSPSPLFHPITGPPSIPRNVVAIPGPPSIPQNIVSGSAALEMQRHLQWYKEVDAIFPFTTLDSCNKGYSKLCAFSRRDHQALVYAGEKWMKDISSSCIVVGTLIITIMFAAAFMVPRGNNQDIGIHSFMNSKFSKTFIISDAVSLFSSTVSVLMFLGILTSRYAEEDFLKSLPTKILIGLFSLFFSILGMMIAFSAAFSIMLHEDSWIGSLVIFLATILVTLAFMLVHFPLLVDIFRLTYGPSIFNRKVKPWLYG